jgi:hypothetical protein
MHGQQNKDIQKESQKEPKESKCFNKICHVRRTNDAKKNKIKNNHNSLMSNKKNRKVPRDPQDNCHISNLRETIEAHGLQVHLHAHSQCTAISSNWSPSFLD